MLKPVGQFSPRFLASSQPETPKNPKPKSTHQTTAADRVAAMPLKDIQLRLDFMETRYPNNKYSNKAYELKDKVLRSASINSGLFLFTSVGFVGGLAGGLNSMTPLVGVLGGLALTLYFLCAALLGKNRYESALRQNYLAMVTQCHLPADFDIPSKAQWKTAQFPVVRRKA